MVSDPEELKFEESGFGLGSVLIFKSMKSEIKPGLVIASSSKYFSPVSILTTVDMEGRSFGES